MKLSSRRVLLAAALPFILAVLGASAAVAVANSDPSDGDAGGAHFQDGTVTATATPGGDDSGHDRHRDCPGKGGSGSEGKSDDAAGQTTSFRDGRSGGATRFR